MAKVDWSSKIGEIHKTKNWGDIQLLDYQKDGKNHLYNVKFIDTGNKELINWNSIKAGTCIDQKQRKVNKQKAEQIRLKERNRLIKQKGDSLDLSGICKELRFLAVDLATQKVGVSFARQGEIVASKLITADSGGYRDRGHKIVSQIVEMLKKGKIDVLIIEDIYLGLNSNVLEVLAEVRGMLTWWCVELDVKIVSVSAMRWKNHFQMPTFREEQKKFALEYYFRHTGLQAESDDVADAFMLLKFILNQL